MRARSIAMAVAAVTTAALGLACSGPVHLTPTQGTSTSRAFAVQVLYPDASTRRREPPGLDSQEASALAKHYLKSLTPESASCQPPQPMLLMTEPAAGVRR
jgi:hypothetical protein